MFVYLGGPRLAITRITCMKTGVTLANLINDCMLHRALQSTIKCI